MAREALHVGDHDAVGVLAEDLAQRVDLGGGAAAAGRRVGLVGDEHGLRRDVLPAHAARLGLLHELLHHPADVLHVEPGPVERGVRGHRPEHLADRREPALAGGLGALHHEAGGAHADDHAVTALVERQRRVLDHLVGRRRAGRQEAGADPAQHRVRGRVVGGHDQHPAAAPGADPVLRERDRLRRARAGGVDLGVRPARPDQLGELRVAHREDPEEEPAVERVRLLLELASEVVDAPLDLVEHHGIGAVVVEHPRAQRVERGQALAAHVIRGVPRHLVGHLLQAGEGRGEDHAGVVAQLVRKRPAVGELRARGGGLVAQHERDARVAERVDARGDRQLGVAPERGQPVLVDAELLDGVERAGAPGELDHVVEPVDRLERGAAVVALDQPRDVLVEHLAAQAARDHVDSLLAVEQARDVGVVEQPLGAREPERRAGDDHRLGRRQPVALGAHQPRPRSRTRRTAEVAVRRSSRPAHRSGRGRRRSRPEPPCVAAARLRPRAAAAASRATGSRPRQGPRPRGRRGHC